MVKIESKHSEMKICSLAMYLQLQYQIVKIFRQQKAQTEKNLLNLDSNLRKSVTLKKTSIQQKSKPLLFLLLFYFFYSPV